VRPVGLTRIDHVAQVMSQDELLTWTLLYTALFDIGKAPEVDVADPGGVVHSRALQSDDGALRFTLNGVDTHRTFAGRFVSDSYGSSVQHLAFASDDILATAERLAENGFESLPIPEAYFTDIAAEFGLQPEFVAPKSSNGAGATTAMAHGMPPTGRPHRSGCRPRQCRFVPRPARRGDVTLGILTAHINDCVEHALTTGHLR
jgi:hypothetical protein